MHSLQGCSQQSLQDRADRSGFIIVGFRNAVKMKITERNISSENKNRQISHISLQKWKLILDNRVRYHYNEKAASGCSADGSAHGSGPWGRESSSLATPTIMWRQKRCLLRKARIYRAFLLPKRRFFSVPKHRCKIAVFPLWIDLNSRKVNIRYTGR